MVDVGEETGELDTMLYKVADNYDEEVAVLTESLVSLLEPLMIVDPGRDGRFHRDRAVPAAHRFDHQPVGWKVKQACRMPRSEGMCNSAGNTRSTTACAQPPHNIIPSPYQGEGRVRVMGNQYAAARRLQQSPNTLPKYPSPYQGEGRAWVRPARGAHRPAFTLVELMMSLIIIGLLASMLGVAVSYALNAAKNVATKADIANLDQALQSYKNNYGSEYPSCMAIPAMAAGNVRALHVTTFSIDRCGSDSRD